MVVKNKCKECGKIKKVKVTTRKKANRVKKHFKNYPICSICKFRMIANSAAKGICHGKGYGKH